jgi:hypothetical protein
MRNAAKRPLVPHGRGIFYHDRVFTMIGNVERLRVMERLRGYNPFRMGHFPVEIGISRILPWEFGMSPKPHGRVAVSNVHMMAPVKNNASNAAARVNNTGRCPYRMSPKTLWIVEATTAPATRCAAHRRPRSRLRIPQAAALVRAPRVAVKQAARGVVQQSRRRRKRCGGGGSFALLNAHGVRRWCRRPAGAREGIE